MDEFKEEKKEEKKPPLTLADGTKLDCPMCGLARSTGRLLIEVHGLTLMEAAATFDNPEATATITMDYGDGVKDYKGFVVLEGVDVLGDKQVRVTLRRRYEEE